MSKLDLEDDFVHYITVTSEAVRSTFDGVNYDKAFGDAWELALDEAQGEVFNGDTPRSYIVIEIRK